MFSIPAQTPYDVKFSLLGIPVRIHPLFWIMSAALGWGGNQTPFGHVLIWIACVFVSILVHEFGHGLTAENLCRRKASVVLYLMGGLCVYDDDNRHPWRRAAVLAMGPGAGFILGGLVLALELSVLGIAEFWPVGWIHLREPPSWFTHLPEWLSQSVFLAGHDLLFINLLWGLFNLLPIYPLDGGQLANVFLTMRNRREGPSRCYIVGILTAGGIAIYLASLESWINAFFVASLAFLNYQLLQAAQAQRNTGYSFEDEDQWWRR
jgi:stage IV sporulation protein FB